MPDIRRLFEYLGIPIERGTLSESDAHRLAVVSILPAISVGCRILTEFIDFTHEAATLRDDGVGRLYAVADTVSTVALALIVVSAFLMAIRPISRTLGTWCAHIAAGSIVLSVASGALVIVLYAFFGFETVYEDLKVFTWRNFAYQFAAVAALYGFLAYRGLSPSTDEGDVP